MKSLSTRRRVLIVGEGRETEYNYFVNFCKHFEDELKAAATTVSVRRGCGGNARNIVEHAAKQAGNFQPNRSRGDRVFLLLDTEGDSNLPGAGRSAELPDAEKRAKKCGIEIIYSSPAIEYWLLCHFDRCPRRHFADCKDVVRELDRYWRTLYDGNYDKSDLKIFERLKDQIAGARDQSLSIDLLNFKNGIESVKANPSTQVYELIAILIGELSGKKCPVTGTWTIAGNQAVKMTIEKGTTIPFHQQVAVRWHLVPGESQAAR